MYAGLTTSCIDKYQMQSRNRWKSDGERADGREDEATNIINSRSNAFGQVFGCFLVGDALPIAITNSPCLHFPLNSFPFPDIPREKAFSDAVYYKQVKEAEANEKLLTPAFLEHMRTLSIANNTKIFFGEKIPNMFSGNHALATTEA